MVKLVERDLYLHAESEIERKIWGTAFQYAIISTQEVQKIIKEGEEYQKSQVLLSQSDICSEKLDTQEDVKNENNSLSKK